MTVHIIGSKKFRFIIAGDIPPNVSDEQMMAGLSQGVNVALNLLPLVKNTRIDILPGAADPMAIPGSPN